jgi:hypothetical protein
MKQVMVRYRVKPDQATRNEELVRAVYDELHRTQPTGLRYATFRMPDGVTFVHLAEHAEETSPLTQLAAFAKFQQGIRSRCDEPPVATELHQIGSYRR